ncbi:MAG: radical SAM protein [Clostridiales bacterium]|nr:radical SAM protein [Clostridiales bacterium]
MIKFNIASINRCTEVEGPYKRLCIWFQGCNIHCKGCCNPDYQPLVPKNLLTLDELVKIIAEAKDEFGIDGVTYSGGEPTLQQNLPHLTEAIHNLGLGVISFTGRLYDEVKDILRGCDVVLDGAYIADKAESKRRILGSANQRIICLTDRYKDCIEDWFNQNDSKSVEVNVGMIMVANGDNI